jgi:hypothetical protein
MSWVKKWVKIGENCFVMNGMVKTARAHVRARTKFSTKFSNA